MKAISLSKTVPLSLMLYQEDLLETVNYDLTFTLMTEAESASEEDMEKARSSQNIGFAKIICFVETMIDNSVVYTAAETNKVYDLFMGVENNFITVPIVNELFLAAALHSKFNSLIDENSCVTTVVVNEKKTN